MEHLKPIEVRDSARATWLSEHERLIILAFCVIGTIRIFVFNAAFPLSNNVDETAHIDLVYRYAHDDIPAAGVEKFNIDALKMLMLYGSPEYYKKDKTPVPAPIWTIPNFQNTQAFIAGTMQLREHEDNHEAGSFPIYYVLAGLWYNAGHMLGMTGGKLLYWVRFLNMPLFMLLIWVSYVIVKNLYAEGNVTRIAFPLMVTFLPQDTFYSISPDALSPLLFAIAFLMLVRIYNHDKSLLYYFLAGLVIAATFLIKLSNITVFAMAAVVLLLKIKKIYAAGQTQKHLLKLSILVAAAVIPVAIWLIRNYLVIGDPLGISGKEENLGWARKPLSEILNHPIFTPNGAAYFFAELTRTFWRGEFTWFYKPIANRYIDAFYVVSTAIFTVVSFAAFLLKSKTNKENRFELGCCFFVVLISVLLLAILSLLFDFGTCPYPNRARPYFTSARLIGGMTIPLLLIYFDGLRRILSLLKNRTYLLLIVTAVIVIAITCSEILISIPAFKSQYNWFHLK